MMEEKEREREVGLVGAVLPCCFLLNYSLKNNKMFNLGLSTYRREFHPCSFPNEYTVHIGGNIHHEIQLDTG